VTRRRGNPAGPGLGWERPRLSGRCRVPGDKAISPRAAILAALARGTSVVRGFSPAGDCDRTLRALLALGVRVEPSDGRGTRTVVVDGPGWEGLRPPPGPLDCGRSGTTMRLLAGVAAGLPVVSVLTGDDQLLRRPMDRVAEPLRRMGARVELGPDGRPPLTVRGGELQGIEYRLPVASAQVKSCVLLAGLRASGWTTVVEDVPTRDHTERLLEAMGARVERPTSEPWLGPSLPGPVQVSVAAGPLDPLDLGVPGDLSSAAPIVAAAALLPGSDVLVEGVGLNPGRTGFLRILERMGAGLEVVPASDGVEPVGTLRVRHARLRGVTVTGPEVPAAVDELPLLGVLGTQAEGVTEVRGAAELRVKESDRIAGLVAGLRALGAAIEELPDGFVVEGPTRLRGGRCDARADHRLAMAFTVAGLVAEGPVEVVGMEFVGDSFPGFEEALRSLAGGGR
jgi:3-phosphoshikimate 1-carboxyvinyltransferase